ncbi:MAG: M4 family metallopeptidase [Crocosphaera sp.]|nr:M4 family metallopeptidase [Crocosphaera sp.]
MSKTPLSKNKLSFPYCLPVNICAIIITIIILCASVAYSKELKNEKAAPQNSPTHIVAETPEIERLKKLVEFEVAEEAKKQVVSWAQWIIAPLAFALAALGVKTYCDVQTWLKKALKNFQQDSANSTREAIDNFNKALEKAQEDFNNASREAINKFNYESKQALDNINDKARQASEVIDQQTSKVRVFAEENIGIIGYMAAPFTRKTKSYLCRMIYDAKNKIGLPGELVRSEGDNPSDDKDVNELYDLLGIAHKFFLDVFDCDISQGSDLIATVHYGKSYNNAYWNGKQLVMGDGDGELFQTFILLEIVVHELSFRLRQNFIFQGEAGSLSCHLADVFGVLAVQWTKDQTVGDADWLIAKGVLTSSVSRRALRDMREPGTAYDDPVLGKDPQPDNYNKLYKESANLGGVYINSGIPNRAFYLAATAMGGYAWEKAGKIWYESAMRIQRKNSSPSFLEFAQETYRVAGSKYGKGSSEQEAVNSGWESVGLVIPLDP